MSFVLTHQLREQKFSQAYLEEAELILSLVSQVSLQAEHFNQHGFGFMQGLKDCLVFGFSYQFRAMDLLDPDYKSKLAVNSKTERVLASVTAQHIFKGQARNLKQDGFFKLN
mmetsp:Transcript_6418/g.10898  ORF Transcript_6418/g.10898 Transcript_6418/m.10898 type:complete len:112 (+) Transcript_6418:979-1314(+)